MSDARDDKYCEAAQQFAAAWEAGKSLEYCAGILEERLAPSAGVASGHGFGGMLESVGPARAPAGWEAALRSVPVGNSAVRKTVVEQCIEAIQALPSHAGDIDKERTAEEWRIGWIVRENQIAFYRGKAQELERMLKEMQSATAPREPLPDDAELLRQAAQMNEALEDDMGKPRLPEPIRDAVYWLNAGGRSLVADALAAWGCDEQFAKREAKNIINSADAQCFRWLLKHHGGTGPAVAGQGVRCWIGGVEFRGDDIRTAIISAIDREEGIDSSERTAP